MLIIFVSLFLLSCRSIHSFWWLA